ncbi:LysE family translocator [Azospirillum sp. TSO22-1]|uniref:LysE family translocator n=1 Tax=Azospirillum sp. TSO22-1 TaxID=716789 RepID=UPI000D61E57E|nr:LysE family translocator [Azospirillum sp. TSO22-1]PWC40704.1 transporter [Azospirillum sp. TSO22-1]
MPLDPHLLQLYLVAATVLVLAPGPDSLLVLARGLTEGRRAGLVATAGITAGNVVQAVLAAAGVSALIAASPTLFDLLRYAGAAYLAWIGGKALWSVAVAHRQGAAPVDPPPPASARRVFANALLTNLLNPKIILFYLAFVPQFVAPERGMVGVQIFLLGLILGGMGCVYLAGVAVLSAGAARRVLTSRALRTALDGVAGVLFLGFALRLLLTERRFA